MISKTFNRPIFFPNEWVESLGLEVSALYVYINNNTEIYDEKTFNNVIKNRDSPISTNN